MSAIQKVKSVIEGQRSENITTQKKKIVFQVGGPVFHPVANQAGYVVDWLGQRFVYELRYGVDAFENLDKCDLLVLMGLDYTGVSAHKEGPELVYRPMSIEYQQVFEKYISSGRPLLVAHGGIGSYDDCPRYGELRGVTWIFGKDNKASSHSPKDYICVKVLNTNHPVIAGIDDYIIYDEIYYNLKITNGLPMTVHAQATWQGQVHPMVITAEGGRVKGAGKLVYLANGHNLKAFEFPVMKKLWMNAVNWLMEKG